MTVPPLARLAITLLTALVIALAIVWSGADKIWLARAACLP
jgi:hypothetical protein